MNGCTNAMNDNYFTIYSDRKIGVWMKSVLLSYKCERPVLWWLLWSMLISFHRVVSRTTDLSMFNPWFDVICRPMSCFLSQMKQFSTHNPNLKIYMWSESLIHCYNSICSLKLPRQLESLHNYIFFWIKYIFLNLFLLLLSLYYSNW